MFMYVDIGSQVTDVPRVILTMRVVDWFWDVPICPYMHLCCLSGPGIGSRSWDVPIYTVAYLALESVYNTSRIDDSLARFFADV